MPVDSEDTEEIRRLGQFLERCTNLTSVSLSAQQQPPFFLWCRVQLPGLTRLELKGPFRNRGHITALANILDDTTGLEVLALVIDRPQVNEASTRRVIKVPKDVRSSNAECFRRTLRKIQLVKYSGTTTQRRLALFLLTKAVRAEELHVTFATGVGGESETDQDTHLLFFSTPRSTFSLPQTYPLLQPLIRSIVFLPGLFPATATQASQSGVSRERARDPGFTIERLEILCGVLGYSYEEKLEEQQPATPPSPNLRLESSPGDRRVRLAASLFLTLSKYTKAARKFPAGVSPGSAPTSSTETESTRKEAARCAPRSSAHARPTEGDVGNEQLGGLLEAGVLRRRRARGGGRRPDLEISQMRRRGPGTGLLFLPKFWGPACNLQPCVTFYFFYRDIDVILYHRLSNTSTVSGQSCSENNNTKYRTGTRCNVLFLP
ncbi:hypothetical protein QYE76_038460 [Lolium multiflorum]|uniref:Uncharacterized protein n=1 Tax=Lolium multiflorum TaxID=4521 RepID=A0AAD8WQY7_LOLMU|nr:hypothetical protein QYE76_038460 [Lolium multiflorum]